MTTKTAEKPAKTPVGPDGVKIGDFFYVSWGYDQTNVDFYQVVSMTPHSVRLQPWTSKVVDDDGGPTTHVVPGEKAATYTDWSGVDQSADYWTQQGQKVERVRKVFLKRVRDYGDRPTFTMNSYSNGYLWDGKPKYQTGSGWGH